MEGRRPPHHPERTGDDALHKGCSPYHTPTKAREIYDVSGAGDTSISLYTLGIAAGATPEEAAELANHAAGVVVGKLGTATCTRRELERSFSEHTQS